MKTICFFLLTMCCFVQAHGQNTECDATIAEINTLVKENKIAEAYTSWAEAGKCTTANEAILSDGEIILQYKIDNSASADEKQEHITKLAKLYDGFDKNFPANGRSNTVKKAMLFKRYKTATDEEIYNLLDKAFKNDAAHFSDANALYTYFDLYFNQFKAGDKKITEDDLIRKYGEVDVHLSSFFQTGNSPRDYKTAAEGLKNLMAPIATCEKLLAFYAKDFEAKKSDIKWLESSSMVLAGKNCSANKTFLNIAAQWYALAPNSKSAYNLGLANMRNRNPDKAIEYFDIAANLESEPDAKANTYYTIATGLTTTDKSKALSYLKKAVAAKPSHGKAYLLMAQMYSGASECTQTPFEKKALYFLAETTAMKAAEADQSIKKIALIQAKKYRQQAPSNAEIKQAKMGKKKIAFKCWINESVTVPES